MNYKKQSINTLIQSCKKKNHKAQMELYQRFNRSLYFSAYRIVKNQEDALDAVQEGFINAFEKLDQFNETGSFEGWLRKIVVRKSIAYYQQNKRFVRDEQVLDNTNYFGQQYKPYIRPDLKLGLKSNGKKITQTWSIDLQNFIFRDNVFIQSYDKSSQTIRTLNQRGFFPDFRYQILF